MAQIWTRVVRHTKAAARLVTRRARRQLAAVISADALARLVVKVLIWRAHRLGEEALTSAEISIQKLMRRAV